MDADELEEEVRRFLTYDENASQLLLRTYVQPLRTGLPLIDRSIALRGGQVLEIASAAGVGRTTALLQVAATCILPQLTAGIPYGGRGAHVVFFDLDGKLDIVRLLQLLDARVEAAHAAARQPQRPAEPVIEDALARFHLVRCHSSFDFLASLASLGPRLRALAAAPGGLACLLLDNVAAYHYLDKVARGAPTGYAGPSGGGEGAPLTLHRVHSAAVAQLRALQRQYRLPIIATKHLVLPGGRDVGGQPPDPWAPRDTMMKPWQDWVTHRLVLRAAGGGGGDAAPAARLAKWRTPDEPAVTHFEIDAGGIRVC